MNNQRSNAEEDLRVIRSLMERATVYRAISAPAALVAGLLSILATGAIYRRPVHGRMFAVVWLIVLVLAVVANAFFIWREARNDDRSFISSGMKLALRAIAPNLLIPAAVTIWFFTTGYMGAAEQELVVVWIAFYGLALLSTGLFAPRSLVYLGTAFLLSAMAIPAVRNVLGVLPATLPNLAMGFTFGLYHLIYAVCAWPRKRADEIEQFAVE
ncbi:MAG: hypothetical protein ACM3KL_06415 [Alphaproteobacteria bacterium]